jgi:hypothetical protein
VVLIILVLVAILVPAFVAERTKAQDGEAKQMAAVTAQAMMIWHQQHDSFAGADADDLARIEPTIDDALGLIITGTKHSFTVEVESAAGTSGGGPFSIDHDASGTTRTCGAPERGGCPDDGRW